MWDTLLGGLLATLGGWGALYFQLRYARKNRMNEITAERKVTANAKAYKYGKEIEAFPQRSGQEILTMMLKREEWFFENRLFLPGKFPAKWLSIRNDFHKLFGMPRKVLISDDERAALEKRIKQSTAEAIDEIYKDMDLDRIVIE